MIRQSAKRAAAEAQERAAAILREADLQSENTAREAELAAKEKLLQARGEFEKVASEQRSELDQKERRLGRKEDELDRRQASLSKKEEELGEREKRAEAADKRSLERQSELDELLHKEREKLEKIAGLTARNAKEELIRLLENEVRMEAAHIAKRIEDEARETAGREAKRIIAMAIERSASDYVSETTVSVVILPSDEMKGRIIGREGRNIRALEMATGIDLIVDDTPEAVILSGFDPFRREIARV